MIQQIGHVEADEPGVEADGVLLAIEHPAVGSAPAPSLQPGADAFAILLAEKGPQRPERALRLPQLTKSSQPGIDPLLLGHGQRAVFRRDEFPDKFAQEGKIRWRQLQRLERRAAGRNAVVERQISAAGGADENLGAAVLVEEDVSGAEPLGLRQQKILHDGFAGPRRAADEGVAEVAVMKREIERRAGRGLEHRNRRSPMVAGRPSGGIGVERGERREIA